MNLECLVISRNRNRMMHYSLQELTDTNIKTITRHGFGVYKRQNIALIYQLSNLYLIGWYWYHENVLHCDKEHVDVMKSVHMKHVRSVGFSFDYVSLGIKTSQKLCLKWDWIEKMLADDVYKRQALLSICVLTSESWRFYPIAKACRNKFYLNLEDSIRLYSKRLPADAERYTLRELPNDWKKLSQGKSVRINYKDFKFSKSDIEHVLRMKWIERKL